MINQEATTIAGQPEERSRLIERLAAVPTAILRQISDRSNDDLRQPGQDGYGAVVEILCDLLDWEEITGERVWRMLHEQNPALETYDDSLWSIEHDYATRNGDEVATSFAAIRSKLVEMLTGMTDADWLRTADLQNHGEITIEWLMNRVVNHDEEHLSQIEESLA